MEFSRAIAASPSCFRLARLIHFQSNDVFIYWHFGSGLSGEKFSRKRSKFIPYLKEGSIALKI